MNINVIFLSLFSFPPSKKEEVKKREDSTYGNNLLRITLT